MGLGLAAGALVSLGAVLVLAWPPARELLLMAALPH